MPRLVGEAAGAQIEGRDRARVDDPLDARAQRLLHDDPGALDIGAHDVVGGGRPEPVVGGGMNEIAHALSAAATEARSSRSPTATSSRGSILVRGLDARTRTRTGWPALRNVAAMAEPTKPLAPVTRTEPGVCDPAGIDGPLRRCGDEMYLRSVAVRGRGFIRKMQTRAVTVAGPERGKRPSRTRSKSR